MSDNYKLIRLVRDAIQTLLDSGWTHSSVVNEIGISHGLVKEIMEFDPVSVNVREPTVEKMRSFLLRNDKGISKPIRKAPKRKAPIVEEFPVEVPESMQDAIPVDTKIERDPSSTSNLLYELSELADKFAKNGYRLDASLTMIYEP
ncbi:MAG: hypothetical protein DRI97_00055 [Bacteroidetes bacterium]|nr:MAG: hypothetical protein DRQ42_09760 [Gammaproteobacteria bacterium]RLD59826.1 MAG: hypothetical protein DRI97_00055 [Bacteroidota bacterium]